MLNANQPYDNCVGFPIWHLLTVESISVSLFSIDNSFNSVFNVKVLVGAFNQEKVLVGAFSVIVKKPTTD